jgi:hypothetical protein
MNEPTTKGDEQTTDIESSGKPMNRRKMLKTAIIAGVGLTAAGMAGNTSAQTVCTPTEEETEAFCTFERRISLREARVLLKKLSEQEASERAFLVAEFDAQNPDISVGLSIRVMQ